MIVDQTKQGVIISNERFSELVKNETKLEIIKKLLANKTAYNNYVDVRDLLSLLEIEKGSN